MYFKIVSFLTAIIFVLSCQQNCIDIDKRIYNRWSDSNIMYYIYDNNTYGLKYLRANLNPLDTITNTDSSFGVIAFSPCRNYMSFQQLGRLPKNSTVIEYRKINAGTWEYTFPNDSVLSYRSQSSIGTFFRVLN